MLHQEIKADYTCTELELYAISDIEYNNLQTDLLAFAAKKSKYTPAFLIGLRLKRTNAMGLPNEETRAANHQVLKNNLVSTFLPPVLDNFNDLKGYIKDAWTGEKPEPRYDAAGRTNYIKATKKNWDNVLGLNLSMQTFIATNNLKLTAGGMTASFVTKVNADALNFTNNYELFMSARETGVARAAKVTANNLLHSDMISVLEDGAERVFRNDAAKKNNYIFANLKNMISTPGSASLKVLVLRNDDTPVVNVPVKIRKEHAETISVIAQAITVMTDADGVALFKSVDPGRYNGEITVNGIKTTFIKEIDTGANSRITIEITEIIG